MTKERVGELSLLYIKTVLFKEGLCLRPNMTSEISHIAKIMGVNQGEVRDFVESLVRSIVDEAFPPKFAPHPDLDTNKEGI